MTRTNHRRSPSHRSLGMAVVAAALTLLPAVTHAQVLKVCGDVDVNGTVTVTDGVQVLRAAAGLSSACTAAICDVDVNGTIGVTDGVNTLRKAAGLPIRENCIPSGNHLDFQIAHLVLRTEPFVSGALATIVKHKDEPADATFNCNNGEDGTYDVTVSDGQLDGSFSTCLVDGAIIDGSADNAGNDPAISLDVSDIPGNESITFDSDGLLGVDVDGGVKYSGNVAASPSFENFDTGDFLLVLNGISVAPDGRPLGGSITFQLNVDSNVPGVDRIRIFYDGSNLARLDVTFDDASVETYKFDLDRRSFN